MASLPMQGEPPQGQQFAENQDVGSGGADRDSAVAVQLIAKTTSLTISGAGSEAGECPVLRDSHDTLGLGSAGIPHSEPTDAQLWSAAEDDGWEGAASGNVSATADAHAMLFPQVGPSMMETPFSTGNRAGHPGLAVASTASARCDPPGQLLDMPNEVLLHILSYLEVCDLLATSRTSHALRTLSLDPYLHQSRLRRTRAQLPPLLASPARPSRADLARRSIFLTRTAFASRKLARSLASIRLARRLAARPSAESLVARAVLPVECLPSCSSSSFAAADKGGKGRGGGGGSCKGGGGAAAVAPALVARKRAVERERVKDGLRAWVGSVWCGQVRLREEGVRRWEERAGVGRVWRLTRFWERLGRGEVEGQQQQQESR